MRRSSTVPAGSTLLVLVRGLRNPATGAITDASVSVSALVDRFTGTTLAGFSPIACTYIDDWDTWTDDRGRPYFDRDGNYAGEIEHDAGLLAGAIYYATVTIEHDGKVLTLREEVIVEAMES